MPTQLYPLFIKVSTACSHPIARVAAITHNGQDTASEDFVIQHQDVSEGNVAVFEAPVTSVPPSMAKVVDDNCRSIMTLQYSVYK